MKIIHHGGGDGDRKIVCAVSIRGVFGFGFFAFDEEEPAGAIVEPYIGAVSLGVSKPAIMKWPLIRRNTGEAI